MDEADRILNLDFEKEVCRWIIHTCVHVMFQFLGMVNFTASSLIGYFEQTSRKPFHGSLVSALDHLMESCIIKNYYFYY